MNNALEIERIKDQLAKAKAFIASAQLSIDIATVTLSHLEAGTVTLSAGTAAPTSVAVVPTSATQVEVVKEELTINDEWKAVLDLLNHGKGHVFVTGGAGTGKSTLLEYFIEHYDGVVAVLAPTGVAALRVHGETIHRFFAFGAHALEKDDIREVSDSRRMKYRAVDVFIIDEISMVRADIMDAIDLFLRKNGRNPNLPFGGARLVMFGDLFQLPPVSKDKDEKKYLTARYGTDTPYFFHAEAFRDNPPKICALTTIFRQKDPTFTDALNAIRAGKATADHLKLINGRVVPMFRPPVDDDLWLALTTTNDSADQANRRMLASINAPAEVFECDVMGDFDLKNAPAPEMLELKPGAAVMFVRNNRDSGVVNGTMGKVISTSPLKVSVKGREVEVEAETWEAITYEYDEKTKRLSKTVKGKFVQIPLKLAAAITIHKSQGLTFDQVIVDFANGAFAAGQAYVALSRCRTLEGMVLRRPVQERDLIVSTEVQRFMAGQAIARPNDLPLFAGMVSHE